MSTRLIWDEDKRRANLVKHGLDFADAVWVLDSDYRMDVASVRGGEQRIQSIAYVYQRLRVLLVVHVPDVAVTRIVSFRAASTDERKAYHDWLAQEADDPQADT